MSITAKRAAKILGVQKNNLFPVPSINSIIRVGKIPMSGSQKNFWKPIWRISSKYNGNQIATIVTMLKQRFHNFAIAFENDNNFLLLSDQSIDRIYANHILSSIDTSV